MEDRSIILKNSRAVARQELRQIGLSRSFIGLIKSFSFNCTFRPNRITGFPVNVGEAVGSGGPTVD